MAKKSTKAILAVEDPLATAIANLRRSYPFIGDIRSSVLVSQRVGRNGDLLDEPNIDMKFAPGLMNDARSNIWKMSAGIVGGKFAESRPANGMVDWLFGRIQKVHDKVSGCLIAQLFDPIGMWIDILQDDAAHCQTVNPITTKANVEDLKKVTLMAEFLDTFARSFTKGRNEISVDHDENQEQLRFQRAESERHLKRSAVAAAVVKSYASHFLSEDVMKRQNLVRTNEWQERDFTKWSELSQEWWTIGNLLKREIDSFADEERGGQPSVILQGDGKPVFVNGIDKGILTKSRYKVVSALVKAFPERRTKGQLELGTGSGDVSKTLSRLSKSDGDWKEALLFPVGYGIGYGISPAKTGKKPS